MHRRTILAGLALLVAAPAQAADHRAFERAKLPRPQAAEAAERAIGAGARAVEVEFEGRGDRPGRFEVKVAAAEALFEVKINAETGEVMEREEKRLERLLRRMTHRELMVAQTTLAQAVAAAEREAGGRAIGAELERDDGRVLWDIELIRDGRSQAVKVNAADGTVLRRS